MNCLLKTVTCLFVSTIALPWSGWLQPVQAQIAGNSLGCPIGTRESTGGNLVQNGNFTTNAGTGQGTYTSPPGLPPVPAGLQFSSDLPYRGDAVYPNDPQGGGLSIQNEGFNGGQIFNAPVGVIAGRGVTAAEAAAVGIDPVAIPTYLYSNPLLDTAGNDTTAAATPAPTIWRQTVPVTENTSYNLKGLFFNLLLGNAGFNPRIRLRIGPSNVESSPDLEVGDGSPIPGFPGIANVRQAWIPVQFSFTTSPGQTSVTLEIVDSTKNNFGDDFGLTAIGLRECVPTMSVTKSAGTPVANADGTFTIPYTAQVTNLAPAANAPAFTIANLQLTENLTQTFANATIVSVGNIQSPNLTVNSSFNGTTVTTLLAPGQTLPAGAQRSVSFTVTVRPGTGDAGRGPFTNTVVATGTTPSGIPVRSQADPAVDAVSNPITVTLPPATPDTGTPGTGTPGTGTPGTGTPGTGTPGTGTPGTGTPPGPTGTPIFLLVKRITNVLRFGAPLPRVNFGGFVDDPATTDDNNPGWTQLVPQRNPIGAITVPNDNPLQSGDVVEYTVYFLSGGTAPASNTSICDPIPAGMTFVPNTTQVQIGPGGVQTGGTFFTPLAPLPTDNSCPDQTNPNGAIIYNLGTLSNLAPNNVGFVRFQVRVN